MNLRIDEAIEYYADNCYNRNLSSGSIKQYTKELNKFKQLIEIEEPGIKIGDIKTIHIERYLRGTMTSGNRTNTRLRKRSVVLSFLTYCVNQEFLEKNPKDKITKIRMKDIDEKKKESLTMKEYERLILQLQKTVHSERNITLINIAVFTGLRVSEITGLNWEDIDFEGKKINIRGKGGKIRTVPLFDDVEREIKQYRKAKREGFMFPGRKGIKPLTERAIFKIINTAANKAKIKKQVGCHTLRRTTATLFLGKGVNIRYIQLLLGHSNIATTMRYANPEEEEVTKQFKEAYKGLKKQIKKGGKKVGE